MNDFVVLLLPWGHSMKDAFLLRYALAHVVHFLSKKLQTRRADVARLCYYSVTPPAKLTMKRAYSGVNEKKKKKKWFCLFCSLLSELLLLLVCALAARHPMNYANDLWTLKVLFFSPPFFVQWLNVFFSQFMAIATPFSHFTFFCFGVL